MPPASKRFPVGGGLGAGTGGGGGGRVGGGGGGGLVALLPLECALDDAGAFIKVQKC